MKVNQLMINVTSEHPDQLASFYRDVVGLAPNTEIGGGAFDVGGTDADRRLIINSGGNLTLVFLTLERETHQLADEGAEGFVAGLLAHLSHLECHQVAVLLLRNEEHVENPNRAEGDEIVDLVEDVPLESIESVEFDGDELDGTECHVWSLSPGLVELEDRRSSRLFGIGVR